ncbi:hypothetical protein ACJZ2D_011684 [Fusarium nematophilum]
MENPPAVKLLKQLMEIPSTSEEEQDIGKFLFSHLKSLNYNVDLIPIAPGSDRCNVYAYLGPNRKARTLLTSHMDTVPPHIPLRIEGDIIYGRGSCDDKGRLAAQIIALEELRAEGAVGDGDVSLLFVVGEEKGGPGMLAVNDMNLAWEAVIFGEPTESKLATGHKGHYVFELFATGIAAHSGYPEKGKSAIATLVSVLEELKSLELPVSELLGPSTFSCGKVEGGAAYNVLAAEAYALCGIRVAADLAEIERSVEDVVGKYEDVALKKSFGYPEVLLDHDMKGLDTMSVSFGTDVPRLKGTHKKYLYGPGSILDAHGENEQVSIRDLIECVAVYKRLVLEVLKAITSRYIYTVSHNWAHSTMADTEGRIKSSEAQSPCQEDPAPSQRSGLAPQPIIACGDIEEGIAAYQPGGFHPVYIGDLFDDRFKVLSKIGYGVYSTVWLVRDLRASSDNGSEVFRALKVLSATCYGQGNDSFEREILTHLREGDKSQMGYAYVCHLVDDFEHKAGNWVCTIQRQLNSPILFQETIEYYKSISPRPRS